MRDFTKEDKSQREKLERNSSIGTRVDMAGALNRLAADSVVIERDAVDTLMKLRASAQARQRTVADLNSKHDAYLAKGERLDRLHPGSALARAPASPTSDIPVGQRDDARNDRIGPDLRDHTVVRDTGGSLTGGGRDHWQGQGVHTVESMRKLAIAKALQNRYW